MDLSPKAEGGFIPDLKDRLPVTAEEAMAYLNSKFRLIMDSELHYEEFLDSEGKTVRAVHQTYAVGAKFEGPETVKQVLTAWLLGMMDAALNSKRNRIYWRMKPKMNVEWMEFPDGHAFGLKIISRSSMV